MWEILVHSKKKIGGFSMIKETSVRTSNTTTKMGYNLLV